LRAYRPSRVSARIEIVALAARRLFGGEFYRRGGGTPAALIRAGDFTRAWLSLGGEGNGKHDHTTGLPNV
jgi:hypothetical protein